MNCPICGGELKKGVATAKANAQFDFAAGAMPTVGSVSKFGQRASGTPVKATVSMKYDAFECPACGKVFIAFDK